MVNASLVFRIILVLCSISLAATVYLIKDKKYIPIYELIEKIEINSVEIFLFENEDLIVGTEGPLSVIAYFSIALLMTRGCLYFAKFLQDDEIPLGSIKEVEVANDAFLPSYLGYFFVVLSTSDHTTFIYVLLIIFTFTFFSRISYFNPMLLILGYKFFYLRDKSGLKILVVTKHDLKVSEKVKFSNLKRINNYTFIKLE